ncbi:uncharacterized protein J8A68_001939, partial [[Candida] subhashii]
MGLTLFHNQSPTTSRRLDRIYISQSFVQRLLEFNQIQTDKITSTHDTINIKLLITTTPTISIGSQRFILHDNLIDDPDFFSSLNNRKFSNLSEFTHNLPAFSRAFHYYVNIKKSIPRASDYLPKAMEKEEFQDLRERFVGKPTENHIFQKMTNKEGSIIATTTETIIELAKTFFELTYQEPPSKNANDIVSYLSGFQKKITEETRHDLELPITEEEIHDALRSTSNQSSPGKDGIPFRFYKRSWDTSGRLLQQEANNIMDTGQLPKAMKEVLIKLIPKRIKNSTNINDFRPISLINTSTRIISSVLNNRLLTCVDDIIGENQTGFMPERRMDYQISKMNMLIKEIEQLTTATSTQALCFLDFEKAFDNFSHEYLKQVLQHLGFGPRMIKGIMSLTTQQTAEIVINDFCSSSFPLQRGTRQGSAISPILFNLAIEPFLYFLEKRLHGISVQLVFGRPLRNSYLAFADDLTIFLNDESDAHILHLELTKFCEISNSKINETKSLITYFNQDQPTTLGAILNFPSQHIKEENFKYLGINIHNFDWSPYIESLRTQLHFNTIKELPIHLRTQGLNQYIFSKIYFRDLQYPMSAEDCQLLIRNIKCFLPPISPQNLFALKIQGGYGLLEIETQLEGKRAKFIFDMLNNHNSGESLLLRNKIQAYLNQYAKAPNPTTQDSKWIFPWYRLLVGGKIEDKRGGYIRDRIPFANDHFSKNEISWIEAWYSIVNLKKANQREHPIGVSLRDLSEFVNYPIEQKDWEKDMEPVNELTFKSRSRQAQLEKRVALEPKGWSTLLNITPSQWQKYWKSL